MQRNRVPGIIQVIRRGPVAGFNGVRRALYGVHKHGQGVHVVFQVQTVGQRVAQGGFQRRKAVGVIAAV